MSIPSQPPVHASAVLSRCRTYRYELWRQWGVGPPCVFVGLNPSTADETSDDPTIRKCVAYAKRWGYGSLCMVNLFAFRATQPKDLRTAADPIGPENDATLRRVAKKAGIIIAAWGKHGSYLDRDKAVLSLLPVMRYYLKLNNDGSPAHPLYLRGDALPFLLPSNHPFL